MATVDDFVAYDEVTGERVEPGDPVTSFRGTRGYLRRLDRARSLGYSGKVTVELADVETEYLFDRLVYHYDNVWGLRVEHVPDPNA
jgi:hypothetical protein